MKVASERYHSCFFTVKLQPRSVDEGIASMSGFHSRLIAFQWLGQKTAHLIYLIYVMYSHSVLTKSIGSGRLSWAFGCLSERKGVITSTPRLRGIFK